MLQKIFEFVKSSRGDYCGSCVFISLYRDIDARMIVDGDLDQENEEELGSCVFY